jgi:hypothetical protein
VATWGKAGQERNRTDKKAKTTSRNLTPGYLILQRLFYGGLRGWVINHEGEEFRKKDYYQRRYRSKPDRDTCPHGPDQSPDYPIVIAEYRLN